jgi:flagellar hook-length control protein FliK
MNTSALTPLSLHTNLLSATQAGTGKPRFSALMDRDSPAPAPAPAPAPPSQNRIGAPKPFVTQKVPPTTSPPERVEEDNGGPREAPVPGNPPKPVRPPQGLDQKGLPVRPSTTIKDPSAGHGGSSVPPQIDEVSDERTKLAASEQAPTMSAAELADFLAKLPVAVTPQQTAQTPAGVTQPTTTPTTTPNAAPTALQMAAAVDGASVTQAVTAGADRTRLGQSALANEQRADARIKTAVDAKEAPYPTKPDATFVAAQVAAQAAAAADRYNSTDSSSPPAGIVVPETIFLPSDSPAGTGAVLPSPVSLVLPSPPQEGAQKATGSLQASPGSPEFAPQLGAQLSAFLRDGVHHARLELNPTEMGPLTVQIQLDGDKAHVHMAAEHTLTREALEQAMPQLASSLHDAGLTLTGGGVSDQPRPPAQDPAQDPAQAPGSNRSNRADINEANRLQAQALTDIAATPTRRRGVVDLMA